jgi:hypothetical protein
MAPTCFVSGHLDVTAAEFDAHYVPLLTAAVARGAAFVVGDGAAPTRWRRRGSRPAPSPP